jgi:hypothetical protein
MHKDKITGTLNFKFSINNYSKILISVILLLKMGYFETLSTIIDKVIWKFITSQFTGNIL